jgi:hypothetical protein
MCVRDIEFTYSTIFLLNAGTVPDRQVLGEWNHLFFFTYEIRNVPINIQFYITIMLLDFP